MKVDDFLNAIEISSAFNEVALNITQRRTWKSMCAYTQTDYLHVQCCNSGDGIEPNYSVVDLLEVPPFADIIATLSELGVVPLMNDAAPSTEVAKTYRNPGWKRRKKS